MGSHRTPLTSFMAFFAAFGLPSAALAINGVRPRTPPTFFGEACIATVDRGAQDGFPIDYTIPFPDDEIGEDELEGSRTFQFFALSTEVPPLQELPPWVNEDDIARALEAGIIVEQPAPADVLSSSSWGPNARAVTTPEQRVPIRCEEAPSPRLWSLDDVEPGVYQIWAHTFEPPNSLWTRRPGLVRVVDGAQTPGPAVSLGAPARRTDVFVDSGATIHGCVAADSGTEVTLSWASASDLDVWTSFAEFEIESPTFEIVFMPPEDTLFEALYIRATAIDPQGRSWTSYTSAELIPFATCPDSDGQGPRLLADACDRIPEPMVFDPIVARPCDGLDGSGGAEDTDTEADTDATFAAAPAGGCRTGDASGWGLLWLLACARRRTLNGRVCSRTGS